MEVGAPAAGEAHMGELEKGCPSRAEMLSCVQALRARRIAHLVFGRLPAASWRATAADRLLPPEELRLEANYLPAAH